MLCTARVMMYMPDSVGHHDVVLGEWSHTTIKALAEVIEACVYGNEVYNYQIELRFPKRDVDTCGG